MVGVRLHSGSIHGSKRGNGVPKCQKKVRNKSHPERSEGRTRRRVGSRNICDTQELWPEGGKAAAKKEDDCCHPPGPEPESPAYSSAVQIYDFFLTYSPPEDWGSPAHNIVDGEMVSLENRNFFNSYDIILARLWEWYRTPYLARRDRLFYLFTTHLSPKGHGTGWISHRISILAFVPDLDS